jgi:hypothetical protein
MMYSADSSHSSIVADGTSLQQDGPADLREFLQQIEVLHVSRTDLKKIDVLQKDGDLRLIHDFRDNQQVVLIRCLSQDSQTLFAHSLETVWGSPRLECAASKNPNAAVAHDAGDGRDLLRALDGARACHHHYVSPANVDLPARRSHLDYRSVGFERAAREFVRRRDLDDLANPFEEFDIAMIDRSAANRAQNRVRRTCRAVDVKTHLNEAIDHALDLLFPRPFMHYDYHLFNVGPRLQRPPIQFSEAPPWRGCLPNV